MAAVILTHPAKAAEQVCHADQLQVWAHELLTDLLMSSDALREDMSYDEQVVAERVIQDKIKSIVTDAFTHPEAMKPKR